MPNEFCSCPFCKADAVLRKTCIMPNGETTKKVWFCKACSRMFVTVTTQAKKEARNV